MSVFEWLIILCLLGGSMYLMWEWTDSRRMQKDGRQLSAEVEAYLLEGKTKDEE